jgi:hypothetical protein
MANEWVYPSFASIILIWLVILIFRQKVMSPQAKSVKLHLTIFSLTASFSMTAEAVKYFSATFSAEIYGMWATKFFNALTFIAVIFFINAISSSLKEDYIGSFKEGFGHGLRKSGATFFLQAFALAMALLTFLSDFIPEEAPSLWYRSAHQVFAVSTAIVLVAYLKKALKTSRRKRETFIVWGGGIALIGFQFLLFYTEQQLEGTWLNPITYLMVSSVSALMLIMGFTEKTTLEHFMLPRPTMEIVTGHADAFSSVLGFERWQIAGRKILFEFDPASDYEKVVQDFVIEALANSEPVALFTRRGSALHSFAGEPKGVKLFSLTEQVSLPEDLSEREMLLPLSNTSLMLNVFDKMLKAYPEGAINIVFDNLSDLVLSLGFEKTYRFMRYAAEMLASSRITALFLVNQIAHGPEAASSLRSLFNNQISFGKAGIQTAKLPKIKVDAVEKISAKRG